MRVFLMAMAAAAALATPARADAVAPLPAAPLEAAVEIEGTLHRDMKSGVVLKLRHPDGGFPVFWDELKPVHDSRIHLLIVDPALSDYHHEHPTRMDREGMYAFFMTPRTGCSYKVWAQVHFATGREETVTATIPGTEDCAGRKPDRTESRAAQSQGYGFALAVDPPTLKKGQDAMMTLTVTGTDGTPFADLEPVMGAFAHLVGFYEDYEHIAHIHPLGDEPTDPDERGGPALTFHYSPEHAGLVRFYAQVKVGNKMVFAPFTALVAE